MLNSLGFRVAAILRWLIRPPANAGCPWQVQRQHMAERLPFPHGSSEESALMCGPGLSANQPQTSYLPGTSAGQRSPGPGGAAKGRCHPGGGESSRKQRRRRDGTEQSTTEKGKDETGKGQKPQRSGFHARKAKLPGGTTQRMK